jgi:ArsR family transcriptional regulator, arsenate/arsenite/antimonite-responsive transcriptional repressor
VRNHADVFKAMADETRLMILALIVQHGECCVCDVMEICGITQSKASRHLQYLRHAGLVADRREGTWVYYRIDGKSNAVAAGILEATAPLLRELHHEELARRARDWNRRKAAAGACQSTPIEPKKGGKK